MLELVHPEAGRHAAWLASHRGWGPGLHEDGFGVGAEDDVESASGFATWVSRLRSLPAAQTWWIVDGEAVLGGIALRTGTDDQVQRLGHVGYGIRPSPGAEGSLRGRWVRFVPTRVRQA
jgi:hypothetical protein